MAKGSSKKSSAAPAKRDAKGGAAPKGAKATGPIRAIASRATWRNDDLTGAGKVAWWTIVALAFFVPIAVGTLSPLGIMSPLTGDIYDTFKVIFLRAGFGIALLAWVIDIVRNGGKIRYTPVFWVFLGFLTLAGISTVLSISPSTAFFGKYRRYDGYWSYLIYGIAMFLTVQYATTPGRIKQLAQAIGGASVIVALYGLMQYAGMEILQFGNVGFEANRSFSTYGNPDLLAGFLAFGIFITLGLALTEGDRTWRIIYWVAFLMNLAVSITAFSRSIWVGSLVGFAAIIIFAIRQRVRWEPVDWGMSGLAGLAAVGFVVRSLGAESAVMDFAKRVTSIFDFESGSASTRFMIWDSAMQAIADKPFFGFGADTFRLIFRRYQTDDYASIAGFRSVADNVHNFPLQLAAGVGVPAAVLYYGTLGWAAVVSAKTCWQLPSETASPAAAEAGRGNRLLLAAFWAAAGAYITHLMFGLSLPATTFLLFIAGGALLAPTARSIEVKAADNVKGYGAVALASVIAAASLWGAVQLAAADSQYGQGSSTRLAAQSAAQASQYDIATSQLGTAIPLLQRAVRLSPANDQYRYELHSALALRAELAVASGESIAAQVVEDTVVFGRDMVERNPWEFDSIVTVMAFYNRLGEYGQPEYLAESRQMGEENIALTPNGLALRYTYADTLRALGEYDLATEQLNIVIARDPKFAEAQALLDEVRAGSAGATNTAQ